MQSRPAVFMSARLVVASCAEMAQEADIGHYMQQAVSNIIIIITIMRIIIITSLRLARHASPWAAWPGSPTAFLLKGGGWQAWQCRQCMQPPSRLALGLSPCRPRRPRKRQKEAGCQEEARAQFQQLPPMLEGAALAQGQAAAQSRGRGPELAAHGEQRFG